MSNSRKGLFRLWLATVSISLLIAGGVAIADWPNTRTISRDWTVAFMVAAREAPQTTPEEVVQALKNADAAGDTTAARNLAQLYHVMDGLSGKRGRGWDRDLSDAELRETLVAVIKPATVAAIDEKYGSMQRNLGRNRATMLLTYLGGTLAGFIVIWLFGELYAWVLRGFTGEPSTSSEPT